MALWLDHGSVQVASRGGPGAIDRAGQLGRLRGWAAERADALRVLLAQERVLYGEWLLLTHTIAYDELPDYLVGLDLWSPAGGFVTVDARDEQLRAAGIASPPRRHDGLVTGVEEIDRLVGTSAYRSGAAEGVIVRAIGGDGDRPRIAKRLAETFVRRDDASWRSARPLNRVR